MEIKFKHIIMMQIIKRYLLQNKDLILSNTSKEAHIEEKWLEEEFKDALFALNNLSRQAINVLRRTKAKIPHYKNKAFLEYMPKGEVLQILPSSTPILSCVLLPFCASISGNIVFVKPSSASRYLARFMQKVFRDNGYKNIFFLEGRGEKFIQKISKRSDFVFYMGSKKIGKSIESFCMNKDIEFLGEFEGNDWAVVFNGDMKKIGKKISDNVLFKGGRDCDSIKGILVQKEMFPLLKSNLEKNVKKFLNENPSKKDIKDPPFCSSLWIKKIKNSKEALDIINLNSHGLSISVFDENIKRALSFADKLNFARVIINSDTLDIHPLIPWGGIKGTSRGGADYWVRKFVNKKLIEIN